MTNYKEYKEAKESVKELIGSKQIEIDDIEREIVSLKKVKRMMDEEFNKKLDEKAEFIG